jgi:hypothetical protein
MVAQAISASGPDQEIQDENSKRFVETMRSFGATGSSSTQINSLDIETYDNKAVVVSSILPQPPLSEHELVNRFKEILDLMDDEQPEDVSSGSSSVSDARTRYFVPFFHRDAGSLSVPYEGLGPMPFRRRDVVGKRKHTSVFETPQLDKDTE